MRWLGRKTIGDWFVKMIEAFAHYICFKQNPLVQFVYIGCAGGGFYIYRLVGYPLVPGPYIAEYHKTIGNLMMFLCYASYAAACWVPPGHVTKSNEKALIKSFKYDEVLFNARTECRTCHVIKPARSKHCSMCEKCVEKFDHHCIWVNQCIGRRNYRFFLLFLLSHSVQCTYGGIIGVFLFLGIIEKENLLNTTFHNHQTGETV